MGALIADDPERQPQENACNECQEDRTTEGHHYRLHITRQTVRSGPRASKCTETRQNAIGTKLPCNPRAASEGRNKGCAMFHPSTERLIEYWSERKSAGRIPSRASINPADFADLIPQAFILGRDGAGGYPIRLAGGFLTELHHRDLAGENMIDLWSPTSRTALWELLEVSRRSGEPFVLTADINAVGATVGMEVSFLPLTTTDGEVSRFLGLYQPIAMVQRLKGRPAQYLSIRRDGIAVEPARPALRLVALEGRRLA